MTRHQGQDPYTELGIPRTADAAAIKKAYRSLAQKYHPDRNEGDAESEENFKRVSAAYAVLSDEERKKQYDEFGEIALDPNFDAENYRRATGGFHGGFQDGYQGTPFSSGNFGDGQGFGHIFEDLFGGRAQGPRPQRGADLETSLDLDFAEAALGAEKRV
ncbi:MAG: DnaJ domain-containing protein, partial [Myxococcota bacterium]|nr:DnaJ domain-containing protein [Myxococcota bacterium]